MEVQSKKKANVSIVQRIEREKLFIDFVRRKYPAGSPRVRVGQRVLTIHGPGVVINEYEFYKQFAPGIKHDKPPMHLTGRFFTFSPLYYQSPYEYIPENKNRDFLDELQALMSGVEQAVNE